LFSKLKLIFNNFSRGERIVFFLALFVLVVSFSVRSAIAFNEHSDFRPVPGGFYREGLVGQPQAINPIISLNPADLDISALIYSNLFELLSDYALSENGKVYVLKLKEGLKWSDGESLTSDDVLFTLKLIQDPETRSPLSKSWQGVVPERISELQLRLTLPAPYSFFENNLKRLPIIPKHIFSAIPTSNLKLSSYNLEPVGSGPYRFKAITKRKDGFVTEYRLVPNEYYYGEKPLIKNFYFKFYEDEKILEEALLLRKIDGFGSLVPINIDKYANTNFIIHKIKMFRYYAIFINANINPILKKKEVRQALDLAIDKEKIVKEIFGENGKAINIPTPDDNLGARYSPEEARGTLANFKLTLNLVVPEIDFLVRTAELIKDYWLQAGVEKVNIIVLTPDDLVTNVIKPRNYELLLFGNVLENVPDLFPFWHSSQRFYPGLNLALYANNRADVLLEKVRETTNPAEHQAFLDELFNIIKNDAPAVFLYTLPYTYLHTKKLVGFAWNDSNDLIGAPSQRFKNVNQWSIAKIRVIK